MRLRGGVSSKDSTNHPPRAYQVGPGNGRTGKNVYTRVNMNRNLICQGKYVFQRNEIQINSKNSTDKGPPAPMTRSASTNRKLRTRQWDGDLAGAALAGNASDIYR